MNRLLIKSNISEVPADALIYSTNVRLALTGGVGAALREKYGWAFEDELHRCSAGTGRQMAEVGEVLETNAKNLPWKRVFHTVATDEFYYTQPETVIAILRKCLRRCVELGDVRSVITSPLGAGYGDLSLGQFVRIADLVCQEYENSALQSFAIVCWDAEEFDGLCAAAKAGCGWWQRMN